MADVQYDLPLNVLFPNGIGGIGSKFQRIWGIGTFALGVLLMFHSLVISTNAGSELSLQEQRLLALSLLSLTMPLRAVIGTESQIDMRGPHMCMAGSALAVFVYEPRAGVFFATAVPGLLICVLGASFPWHTRFGIEFQAGCVLVISLVSYFMLLGLLVLVPGARERERRSFFSALACQSLGLGANLALLLSVEKAADTYAARKRLYYEYLKVRIHAYRTVPPRA